MAVFYSLCLFIVRIYRYDFLSSKKKGELKLSVENDIHRLLIHIYIYIFLKHKQIIKVYISIKYMVFFYFNISRVFTAFGYFISHL